MLPNVNFRRTAKILGAQLKILGAQLIMLEASISKEKVYKKLNSATFICHLQFVTLTSVL